jgi:hypothetical protein
MCSEMAPIGPKYQEIHGKAAGMTNRTGKKNKTY